PAGAESAGSKPAATASAGGGVDQDLRGLVGAEAQAGGAHLEQAGAAGAQDQQPAAGPDAQFCQPGDPARLAPHPRHLRPLPPPPSAPPPGGRGTQTAGGCSSESPAEIKLLRFSLSYSSRGIPDVKALCGRREKI